jgi:hypothetical protein
LASDAAIIPLPKEEVTPPVTKICLAIVMVICFESVLLIFGDGLINSFHRLLCHSLVRPELHSTALSQ